MIVVYEDQLSETLHMATPPTSYLAAGLAADLQEGLDDPLGVMLVRCMQGYGRQSSLPRQLDSYSICKLCTSAITYTAGERPFPQAIHMPSYSFILPIQTCCQSIRKPD